MSGFKKYIVVWTETHQKEVLARSKDEAITDATIISGDAYTCTKSKNFKIVSPAYPIERYPNTSIFSYNYTKGDKNESNI